MMVVFRAVLALLALSWCAIAFGHDTYLLPERDWRGGTTMFVVLTSAETFPKLEFGPKRARVADTVVRGPDTNASLRVAREGAKALKLRLQTGRPGAYAVGLALGPRDIDLTPDKVALYLSEIDAPRAIRDAYAAQPEPRQWRETYEKFAKIFVCHKTCGRNEALSEPSGLAAEFVALKETLETERVSFRLLSAGAPVADQAVAIVNRKGRRVMVRTQPNGAFALPAGLAGPVLLSAVLLKAPASTNARYTSVFVSLTFDSRVLGR